jgi:cephalosporin-C deacetylase
MKSATLGRVLFLLVIPAAASAQTRPATKPAVQVKVVANRPDALYHVGEPVTFKVTLSEGAASVTQGDIAYVLTNDGQDNLGKGKLAITGNPLSITGKLDAPGFLRCQVLYVGPDKAKCMAVAAAGIDPLRIKPSMPPPHDFDAFWAEQKKKLAEMPMEPVLMPVTSPDQGIECFDVQIRCLGGAPVSGYLARPRNAGPRTLPAILSVHGAGVRSSNLGAAVRDARFGALGLDINAHGIPNGRPKAFYDDLTNGRLNDYRIQGRESRETYYFLGMYLRLIRAMEFLTARPEWDGRTLIVHGGSQGGGQSIVAAGLDPRVTAFVAHVPAMCDHTGRINGWPRLVPRGPDGKPEPKAFEASRYFDAMNFATRTGAEALLSVGFIDDTCRPTTVYAAYNNLKGPKRMVNEPMMTHAVWPSCAKAETEMIKEHIAKMRQCIPPR